jgi:hypothetical protein
LVALNIMLGDRLKDGMGFGMAALDTLRLASRRLGSAMPVSGTVDLFRGALFGGVSPNAAMKAINAATSQTGIRVRQETNADGKVEYVFEKWDPEKKEWVEVDRVGPKEKKKPKKD